MEGAEPSCCVLWMGDALCSTWDTQDLLFRPASPLTGGPQSRGLVPEQQELDQNLGQG